ncbi:MAG TPA: sugar-transfer associated ATP-grasp domain-containing protein [Candidatus Bathyarchaeia archaeon]|nr:sugar-transfer associated ATP-grasp domain-containing protein [Candidatus Bathyarchaeia archaeon]
MIAFFKNSRKILGMNARNLTFIRPNNLRRAKRLADDKLLSKRFLKKADLPVPSLVAKIKNLDELEDFDWSALPDSWVLKPNRGFGGEGILVVYGKKKNMENTWIKADGSLITIEDIKTHITNIIDGSYSLSGTPDIAFFEERLKLLKLFKPYAFKGIPDIRIVVYNKVPVMAMLRLPTRESDGKANLQQGAVGVGIDMASGVTTTAVYHKNTIIEYLPGSRLVLSGIRVPYWKTILSLAVRAQEISGLGYLGADIAIDRDRGPVFLELNARPGLSIQIANLDGLLGRLQRVEGLKIKTAEKGVAVGMNLFGGEIEEEIEDISGKKIIGTVEKVKLIGKNGRETEVEAKIDTGAQSSSLDVSLAKELGFEDVLSYFEKIEKPSDFPREQAKEIEEDLRKKYLAGHEDLEDIVIIYSSSGVTIRPKVKISFVMNNEEVISKTNVIKRTGLKYPMIVGKKDLKKFLIQIK